MAHLFITYLPNIGALVLALVLFSTQPNLRNELYRSFPIIRANRVHTVTV